MRRWIFHYEMGNAIVRLITFIIITWTISAWVNSQNGPDQPIRTWMINCFILLITDIVRLSIVSDNKYHGKTATVKDPNLFLKLTVMKVLIFPMSVATCLSVFAVLRQIDQLQYTTSQLMVGSTLLDNHISSQNSTVSLLILIISSWSSTSYERRQMLRKTSLRLLAPVPAHMSVDYRFVIGQPPSARKKLFQASEIMKESDMYHDLLMVPSSDIDSDKSRKVFEAMTWAKTMDHDYIVKSDDNVFVRWDTLLDEISQYEQPKQYYWKGLAYKNIPIQMVPQAKSLQIDYALPVLPAYTHSMLYLFSKDMLNLIVLPDSPRKFISGDGENIAIWLFGFNIQPVHDRRIQDGYHVCEEDMIGKRIDRMSDMLKMYLNVVHQRPLCTGFESTACAPCYSCNGKNVDWRSINLLCKQDGITVKEMSGFAHVAGY